MCANIIVRSKRKRRTSCFRNDMPVAWHRIPARALVFARLYDLYERKDLGGEYLDAWIDAQQALAKVISREDQYHLMQLLLARNYRCDNHLLTAVALALRWTVANEVKQRRRALQQQQISLRHFVRFIRTTTNGV